MSVVILDFITKFDNFYVLQRRASHKVEQLLQSSVVFHLLQVSPVLEEHF